ncbi:uncharacterized protein DUF5069 [Roseimicrobium gellanilyticum]|uniref:Uncharacterized protein DUF5069 n=2 Tax=Roseimicrobium gellanilyticum TaxID=748857 RepID=A0A366HSR5_9BACT|nr:uncharacterized protein DUF5069 [Roseimicrobium gellanilyticum]
MVGGIVHFGRMLDKIRLHAEGKLPPDYTEQLGDQRGTFDGRCVRFLKVNYDALRERTLAGGSDDELLDWSFANGRKPNEEEILIWNAFMTKRGWRDEAKDRLVFRLNEAGFGTDCGVETMFDFIDKDEGHPPRQMA